MIKFCPKCLVYDVSGVASYCGKDGAEMEPLKRCACGQEIFPAQYNLSLFCISCGKEFEDDLYVQQGHSEAGDTETPAVPS